MRIGKANGGAVLNRDFTDLLKRVALPRVKPGATTVIRGADEPSLSAWRRLRLGPYYQTHPVAPGLTRGWAFPDRRTYPARRTVSTFTGGSRICPFITPSPLVAETGESQILRTTSMPLTTRPNTA